MKKQVMILRNARLIGAAVFCCAAGAQAGSVDWGTAVNFAVLGGSTVTSTGATEITGDLGVSPGGAITGFPPGIVTGTIHAGDAVATQAHNDVMTAYNALVAITGATDLTGQNLGGLTLTPGAYHFSSSAQMTGILILDGQGLINPEFVFQIGSTLTTASASSILLINGALYENIFFQVGSSATLGTGTDFYGNIIALTSDTLNSGATVNGRVFAINGSVTLDGNTVIAVPEPASAAILASAMMLLLASRRRPEPVVRLLPKGGRRSGRE